MALENFIPEIWTARLLAALDKSHVYASPIVANRDYEGEIRAAGDTVRINSIGDVTISSYTKNTNMSAPEALTDAQQTLLIDQQKYFNFQIDDIDRAQQRPKVMDEAMRRAAYALRDTVDQFMAALYTDAGLTSGLGTDGTPLVPSVNTVGTTFYDYLVDMGVLLDEQNCPKEGRWVILPPWAEGRMRKDSRYVAYGTEANRATAAGEAIGRAAGFAVLTSNNVPNTSGTKYKVLAGHPDAWTFAEQIASIEGYRPELRFADAVKGLHVYGGKVTRPNCLALGTFDTA